MLLDTLPCCWRSIHSSVSQSNWNSQSLTRVVARCPMWAKLVQMKKPIAGKVIAWQRRTALMKLPTYYCSISNIMFEWPHVKFQPTAEFQSYNPVSGVNIMLFALQQHSHSAQFAPVVGLLFIKHHSGTEIISCACLKIYFTCNSVVWLMVISSPASAA